MTRDIIDEPVPARVAGPAAAAVSVPDLSADEPQPEPEAPARRLSPLSLKREQALAERRAAEERGPAPKPAPPAPTTRRQYRGGPRQLSALSEIALAKRNADHQAEELEQLP
jgi:hypothetical protein